MSPPLIAALLCALFTAAVAAVENDNTAAAPANVAAPAPAPAKIEPPAAPSVVPLAEELSLALRELESPMLDWSPSEVQQMSGPQIANLGSIAVGQPNRGALLNSVQLPEGEGYERVDPARSWGTVETVLALKAALDRVHADDPTAPLLYVGQLSAPGGGWLKRHKSHQSGRDVDLGLYYRDGSRWYLPATEGNLDVPRTWKLVTTLLETGQIEYIFADHLILRMLAEHAAKLEINGELRSALFYEAKSAPLGVMRHAWGHRSHLHVRFKSELAEQRGQKLAPRLAQLALIPRRSYR